MSATQPFYFDFISNPVFGGKSVHLHPNGKKIWEILKKFYPGIYSSIKWFSKSLIEKNHISLKEEGCIQVSLQIEGNPDSFSITLTAPRKEGGPLKLVHFLFRSYNYEKGKPLAFIPRALSGPLVYIPRSHGDGGNGIYTKDGVSAIAELEKLILLSAVKSLCSKASKTKQKEWDLVCSGIRT